MMKQGIAIFKQDPKYISPEETIKILEPLPLSFLAYEKQDCMLIAQALELERVRIVTLNDKDIISTMHQVIHEIVVKEKPDRIYFRLFSNSLSLDPIMELLDDVANIVERVGIISPIGEMFKLDSITRKIFGLSNKRFEYAPIINNTKKITKEIIEMVHAVNGKDFMAFVLSMGALDEIFDHFIMTILVANGATEICFPSLSFASRDILFHKENDMAAKRKPTTKRKPKEILMPPEGEKTSVKIKCLFPLARRVTPSLNGMVTGSYELGQELNIVELVKVHEELIFGKVDDGFYICLRAQKIAYTEYL